MARQKQTFSQRLKNAALFVLFLPLVLPLGVVAVVLHLLFKITLYLLVWVLWLPSRLRKNGLHDLGSLQSQ
jgi:hypothetical protein